jgi:hypothetical protein
MLFGMVGLLGLFPGRTASLPGVLLRRQLRAAEPWPDRFGILLRSVLERGPMHERFSTTANAASIHFRAVTRHLFSRDAEYDRERLSWRCVGRRREEPAARRRATDGPTLLTLRMYRPCAHRRGPRSLSPRFIDRLVSDDRPGSRRVPRSFRRAPPRSYAVTGSGIRQNDAVHSSKTIESKTVVSPRAVSRGDPHAFLPSKSDRGACIAPGRARRTSIRPRSKSRSHMVPPRHQR